MLLTRLLLTDLLRRRLTVLLLFVVPAIFDGVVLATTARREVTVTIGVLREIDPTPSPLVLDVLDTGERTLDERALSLVFLGNTAVAFLACFLAFYLVHRRTEVDARLVLAGAKPHHVLGAKLAALLVIVTALAAYEVLLIEPWVEARDVLRIAAALFLTGLVYGCAGLLVGALVRHELEGAFFIVLLANVDAGWLQNPAYYASSERKWIIESLPAWPSTQLAITAAFTGAAPSELIGRALAWAAALSAAAMGAFWLRIAKAPARVSVERAARARYAKVLLASYAVWIAGYQLVGRYAQTLETHDPTTWLDEALPLIPAFVWPYELCYVFPFLSLAVMKDWRRFDRAVVALALANLTAFAVYLSYPVAFPRPELGGSLAERVIAAEYAADFHPGANNLPSMHVAMSWIMGLAMWGQRGRLVNGVLAVLILSITASTLFLKQHLVADAATGIAWGLGSWWAAGRLVGRRGFPVSAEE